MNTADERPQLQQVTGDVADNVATPKDSVDCNSNKMMGCGDLPESEQWELFIKSGKAGASLGMSTLLVLSGFRESGGEKGVKERMAMFGRPGTILAVLLGLSAQVLMPIALFWHAWTNYSSGFCPGTGDVQSKLAMHAVASLYLMRMGLRTFRLYQEYCDRHAERFFLMMKASCLWHSSLIGVGQLFGKVLSTS